MTLNQLVFLLLEEFHGLEVKFIFIAVVFRGKISTNGKILENLGIDIFPSMFPPSRDKTWEGE